MTPAGTKVVEHQLWIEAPVEDVFAYFTDPAKMVRWMGIEATLDPRPGGLTRIVVNPEAVMRGEYVEVTPHSRVVFTWGWEDGRLGTPSASTVVEVSLTPEGEGTRLQLTHRELPDEAVAFHRLGWAYYLGRLEVTAAGLEPGPDPWADPEAARRLLDMQG